MPRRGERGTLLRMKLTEEQVADEMETVEWQRHDEAITREWKLPDFRAAIAFVNEIAELAEAADHHPDILIHSLSRVRVTLTTHFVHGLTQRDFDLARQIDAL